MPHSESGLVELSPVVAFDLFDAKLRAPVVRPGSVSRTPLVNRLRGSRSRPVVTALAPAGYGKTTVIAQWADRDDRPFAWLSIDEDDNDPVTFSTYVAAALSRVAPVDPAVFDALESPVRSTAPFLRRLTSALLSAPRPLVLVLDNVHLLRSRECVDVVAAFTQHFPEGSTLVL